MIDVLDFFLALEQITWILLNGICLVFQVTRPYKLLTILVNPFSGYCKKIICFKYFCYYFDTTDFTNIYEIDTKCWSDRTKHCFIDRSPNTHAIRWCWWCGNKLTIYITPSTLLKSFYLFCNIEIFCLNIFLVQNYN